MVELLIDTAKVPPDPVTIASHVPISGHRRHFVIDRKEPEVIIGAVYGVNSTHKDPCGSGKIVNFVFPNQQLERSQRINSLKLDDEAVMRCSGGFGTGSLTHFPRLVFAAIGARDKREKNHHG